MFSRIKPAVDVVFLLTSFAGAGIIAANIDLNVIGYWLFLVSSIAGFTLVWNSNASKSLLLVNAMFAIINIVGIVRYST